VKICRICVRLGAASRARSQARDHQVTAFRQVACRPRTDRSYLISNYNLSFPLESDNMNLFELVQDPPIMLVVAVVHNA
jgi:hypothetical protein